MKKKILNEDEYLEDKIKKLQEIRKIALDRNANTLPRKGRGSDLMGKGRSGKLCLLFVIFRLGDLKLHLNILKDFNLLNFMMTSFFIQRMQISGESLALVPEHNVAEQVSGQNAAKLVSFFFSFIHLFA